MNLRIRNNNLAWLPVRTSLYIENQKELIQKAQAQAKKQQQDVMKKLKQSR